MNNLTNKVAIVTGSTSGIGKAIAVALAEAGANVMINSKNSVTEGEELANSLPAADYYQADIAIENQARSLIDATINHWGQLDILVNNVGQSWQIPHEDLEAATPEIFQELFNTNVLSAYCTSRAALPHLANSENANIVNISSVAGVYLTGSSIPYAVSKAALNHLTKLMARVAGPNVRVNAVAPGFINTERTESWHEMQEYYTNNTLLKRPGEPNEIANCVLGIIQTGYMTGQVIVADGGFGLK